MENLLEAFGVSPEEQKLVEKTESIILRLGPTKYVRKNQSRFVDPSGNSNQMIKIEIHSNGRIHKAAQVLVDVSGPLYRATEDIYANIVSSCLTDVTPTPVNQYKR
ncbi:unnamed protein product [Orchesella dallaii]|uniref:Uncharacterized protein n=1 Tax=Orchesella dallaii TaxID=48710 RepID=A0ABP1RUG1_9HEXA